MGLDGQQPKLGYVLPTYSAKATNHHAHIPRLLAAIGRWVDLEVVIWNAADEPELPGVQTIHRLPAGSKARRWLALRRLIAGRVRAGTETWFVRSWSLLAWAVHLSGAKTIYWHCGIKPPATSLRQRLGYSLGNVLMRRVHRMATAPGLAETYQRLYGIPVSQFIFLDNDLDLRVFHPTSAEERAATRAKLGVRPEQQMLLFVHRVCYDRGGDYLVPMMEAAVAAGHDPVLVAVGYEGDRTAELTAYANANPGRVIQLGPRPNAELPELYAAADLFLLPSRVEGFPRVVLESMACGTPLVGADVGITAHLLPAAWHDRALAPYGEVAPFVDQVVDLLGDPEARARLGAELLERAARYDTPRVARRYVETLFPDHFRPGEDD
ncbi:MAG TPA: hypothetical protein DCZ72_14180 [Armatimonadetes bacterium]|nr:hypothetical protein [Armatimonadota bacterium]